jgi:hypothetical protein
MRVVARAVTAVVLGAATVAVAAPPSWADTVITSCTEAALRNAMQAGGTATYGKDCTVTFGHPITVTGSVDVEGGGHNVTFDGNGQVRLFTIAGTVTFGGLTLQSGAVHGAPGAPGASGGTARGGALYIDSGATVTLTGDSLNGDGVRAGDGGNGANGSPGADGAAGAAGADGANSLTGDGGTVPRAPPAAAARQAGRARTAAPVEPRTAAASTTPARCTWTTPA